MNAMSGAARVRPLRREDEPVWRPLWRAYLAFYDTEAPDAVYASTFERLLSGASGEFRGFVAESGDDGSVLGIAHYIFHRHCWSVADVVYLQDLYVAPEARGLGLGRALIEAVYAAADAEGAANVYWLTQSGNATARRLYDRLARPTDFMKYTRT